MPRAVATDPATKARALQRAAEVGAAQAARETGIPGPTIRAWRRRSGEASPPAGADAADWAKRKTVGANSSWEVAQAATRRALELIAKGDMLAAQRAMITAGIAADKTGQLEEAAHRAEDRRVRLSSTEGKLLSELIRSFFSAVDVPLGAGSPPAVLMASFLRQAGAGVDASTFAFEVSDREAAVARRWIREHVATALRADLEAEQRDQAEPQLSEPLALPAPGGTEVRELQPLAGPRTALRVFPERQREPAVEEVVTGEVVADEPPAARYADGAYLRVVEPGERRRSQGSRHRI